VTLMRLDCQTVVVLLVVIVVVDGLDGEDLVQRRVGVFEDFDAGVVVVDFSVVVQVVVEIFGQIWRTPIRCSPAERYCPT